MGSSGEDTASSEASKEQGSSSEGWSSDDGSDDEDDTSPESGMEMDEQFEELLAGNSSSEDDSEGLEEVLEEGGVADVGAVVMNSAEREAFLDKQQGDESTDSLSSFEDEVVMSYSGHRNSQTVKGVSFLGEDDRYVMSGSDDGHIYIWSTRDGVLRQWLKGDAHVVNCLEPHPRHPLSFATSGIDDDIKLWSPIADKRSPVPEQAWAVIDRNKKGQGARRIPAASARRILMRLQHLAQSREDVLQQMQQRMQTASQERVAGVDGEEGEGRGSREALNIHMNLRQEFEEGEDEEDNPDYTPGDCVIA